MSNASTLRTMVALADARLSAARDAFQQRQPRLGLAHCTHVRAYLRSAALVADSAGTATLDDRWATLAALLTEHGYPTTPEEKQ